MSKSHVASLNPRLFRPLDLAGDNSSTLFTILLFSLESARPLWAPRMLATLAPRIMQSNWRFYGHIAESASCSRPGVFFFRTVTTSWMLSVFGRRLARCFPLRRAHRMSLAWDEGRLKGSIDPGGGSSPKLLFEGERTELAPIPHIFRKQFSSYNDYAGWIIDQHLSLSTWPREYVVQDMHLEFQGAKITPLRSPRCHISSIDHFVADGTTPVDCFAVEGLRVFLDSIYAQDSR